MSKHRKSTSLRAFLSRNGFYIALVVCVIAAAVASYTAVSNILSNLREDNTVIQQPPVTTPVEPDSLPSDTQPETPPRVTEPDPEADEPASADQLIPVYQAPIAGASVQKPFSGEELVYNETLADWRTHNGVDYAAAEGTPVLSVFSGEVTRAGFHPLLGYFVEQKLDSGYTVLYANLAPLSGIKAGDRISQGVQIGTVGNSAILENGDPPHLHFEVRNGDYYIDPQSLFQ